MKFKTRNSDKNAEKLLIDIDGKEYNVTYRHLSKEENKKLNKELTKQRKKFAFISDCIEKGEKLIKSGKTIQEIKKELNITIKEILEAIEIGYKIQNSESELEKVELEEKLTTILESLSNADQYRTFIIEKQLGGTDKEKLLQTISEFEPEDLEDFIQAIDEEFEKKRQGKLKE